MSGLPERAERTWRDGPTSAAGAPGSPTAVAAPAPAAPLPAVLPNGRPRFAGVPPPLPPDLPVCFCMARVLELGASKAERGRTCSELGIGWALRWRRTRGSAGLRGR